LIPDARRLLVVVEIAVFAGHRDHHALRRHAAAGKVNCG
jgi:hypothetical protein